MIFLDFMIFELTWALSKGSLCCLHPHGARFTPKRPSLEDLGAARNDGTRTIVFNIYESAPIDVSYSTHLSGQPKWLWPTFTAVTSIMVMATDEA